MNTRTQIEQNSPQENKRLLAALWREFNMTARVLMFQLDAEAAESYECRSGTASAIMDVVCRHFAIDRAVLSQRRRTLDVALARQIAMVLVRENTTMTLIEIGNIFNRDHGTVIHAQNAIDARAKTEPAFALRLASIRQECLAEIATLPTSPARQSGSG